MRRRRQLDAAFLAGVGFGVILGGVTFVTAAAVRRMLARRRDLEERQPFIDGVHEPDEVELHVRPAEEANACEQPPRLESEIPEFSPMSQRW